MIVPPAVCCVLIHLPARSVIVRPVLCHHALSLGQAVRYVDRGDAQAATQKEHKQPAGPADVSHSYVQRRKLSAHGAMAAIARRLLDRTNERMVDEVLGHLGVRSRRVRGAPVADVAVL